MLQATSTVLAALDQTAFLFPWVYFLDYHKSKSKSIMTKDTYIHTACILWTHDITKTLWITTQAANTLTTKFALTQC